MSPLPQISRSFTNTKTAPHFGERQAATRQQPGSNAYMILLKQATNRIRKNGQFPMKLTVLVRVSRFELEAS